MKKVGRNDPCPCGSGKKFKKCCERKYIGKKFMATKIDTQELQAKSQGVSSFFQKNIIPTTVPPKKEEEKPSATTTESSSQKKEEEEPAKKEEKPQEKNNSET